MTQLKSASAWSQLVEAWQDDVPVEGRRLSIRDICRLASISPKTYGKLKRAHAPN